MRFSYKLSFILSLLFIATSFALPILAQDFLEQSYFEAEKLAGGAGYSPTSDDNAKGDLIETLMNILNIVFGFIGVGLVLLIMWAGWLWMTAGGNERQVEEAVSWIKNALIGLGIILAAYGITNFIFTSFYKISSGQ